MSGLHRWHVYILVVYSTSVYSGHIPMLTRSLAASACAINLELYRRYGS